MYTLTFSNNFSPDPTSYARRSCRSSSFCPSFRTPGPSSRPTRCSSTPSSSTYALHCPKTAFPPSPKCSSSPCPSSSPSCPTSRRISRCKSRCLIFSLVIMWCSPHPDKCWFMSRGLWRWDSASVFVCLHEPQSYCVWICCVVIFLNSVKTLLLSALLLWHCYCLYSVLLFFSSGLFQRDFPVYSRDVHKLIWP